MAVSDDDLSNTRSTRDNRDANDAACFGVPCCGVHGRYLRIDLTTATSGIVEIPAEVSQTFIGGVGLGTWILHREAPVGVDPLAPEAPLIFAFSPLVGTPLTTSAKFAVVAKSPLTQRLTDALSSSHFAIQGKKMGYDALVFVGRAATPSVWVVDQLHPTTHWGGDLWGKSAAECEQVLSSWGRVCAIGIAGENLVRYATISNDGRHAGRGGLGAVMGSKLLKGVVAKGTQRTTLAEPKRVIEIARDFSERSLGPATAKYRELGTVANLLTFNRLGALPTRNFQQGHFEQAESLSPEALAPIRQKARNSCAACTIGCEHIYGFKRGEQEGTVRIEYENMFALGPLCGVTDPDAVLAASERCDHYGLDTISAGGSIAFAMECRQRGLLPEAPQFGEGDHLLQLLDDIAHRRGLGELLAEGSRVAAQRIGHDTLAFAPQVKGLEIPGYEPRALQGMALGFAVGTRGADHNRSGAYELDFSSDYDRLQGDERTARAAVDTEDRGALIDSMILCKFLRGAFRDLYTEAAEMLQAVTGWKLTGEILRHNAKSIVDLKKAFNIREGWLPEEDTLPRRFLEEAVPAADSSTKLTEESAVEGALPAPAPQPGARFPAERLQGMIRAYNLARQWDTVGYLHPDAWQRLVELGVPQLES